jgi:cytochrome c1
MTLENIVSIIVGAAIGTTVMVLLFPFILRFFNYWFDKFYWSKTR